MFKKIALIVPILALALVSCALSPAPVDKDTAFLQYARTHDGMADKTDSYLLEIASGSCDALKAGYKMRDLVNTIRDTSGVTLKTKTDVAEVVGFGVATYCPELQDDTLK